MPDGRVCMADHAVFSHSGQLPGAESGNRAHGYGLMATATSRPPASDIQPAAEMAPPSCQQHSAGSTENQSHRLVLAFEAINLTPPQRFGPKHAGLYIGRGTLHEQPSMWGSPFRMKHVSRDAVVAQFRRYLADSPTLQSLLPTLSHLKIRCNCTLDQLCHGDVIVEACVALAESSVRFEQCGIEKQAASLLASLVVDLEWPVQKRPHLPMLSCVFRA